MCEVNPEGIANRQVDKKMKKKQLFASQEPLWIVSHKGPDKLCGCQNSTFLLGVYGYLDTISRKKLFIFIFFFCNSFSISFSSPSQPEVIEKKYLKYLNEPKLLSHFVNSQKCRITFRDNPVDSITCGLSINNKTEWFWRDLYHRSKILK